MDGNLAKLEEGIMQLEVILTPKNHDPETQYIHFDGYDIDITDPDGFLNGTATAQWLVIDKTEQDYISEAISRTDTEDGVISLSAAKRLLYSLSDFDSDEERLANILLHPYWRPMINVVIGEVYSDEGKLYKVIQAHTTSLEWHPDITPALFNEISEDEYPEWVRPTGAHDAYMTGDKVTFEGKKYISLADNNVYSPTEYPLWWQEK